jgi:hypothetical protein
MSTIACDVEELLARHHTRLDRVRCSNILYYLIFQLIIVISLSYILCIVTALSIFYHVFAVLVLLFFEVRSLDKYRLNTGNEKNQEINCVYLFLLLKGQYI